MKRMILMLVSLMVVSLLLVSCNITGNAVSPYTCTDSDGGRIADVQGTVKNKAGSFTDECRDARTLHENYCKGNVQRLETVPCRYGCEEGACISYFAKH